MKTLTEFKGFQLRALLTDMKKNRANMSVAEDLLTRHRIKPANRAYLDKALALIEYNADAVQRICVVLKNESVEPKFEIERLPVT